MKKIIFNVELTISEESPTKLPFSKETYANMITDCIRNESSEDEITNIKTTLIDCEGIQFEEES